MRNISNLLSYFIECVEIESFEDLSFPTFIQGDKFIPLEKENEWSASDTDQYKKQLPHKFRRNLALGGSSKTIYYGWPIQSNPQTTKNGNPYAWLSPVFILKVEYEQSDDGYIFKLVREWPKMNDRILKQLTSNLEEKVSILDQLGISETEDLPQEGLNEYWQKFINYFPEINLAETIDPNQKLEADFSNLINEQGYYNKAILFIANPPKYSKNLLKELKILNNKDLNTNTSLNVILEGNTKSQNEQNDFNPSMITPLNSSQRAAVKSAFNNRLTVITGPPGTGKSQVVLNILANAFEQEKSVLFTSKNNKAVDVVCEKILNKIDFPINLRLGAKTSDKDYTTEFLDLLDSALAGGNALDINRKYRTAKRIFEETKNNYFSELNKLDEIVDIRNKIDNLDQEIEKYENLIDNQDLLNRAQDVKFKKTDLISLAKEELQILNSDKWPFFYRVCKIFSNKFPYKKIYKYCEEYNQLTNNLLELPDDIVCDVEFYNKFIEKAVNFWNYIRIYNQISNLKEKLDNVSENKIESLSQNISNIEEDYIKAAIKYFETLGNKRMISLSQQERQALNNYYSVIKQLAGDYPGNKAYAQLKERQEKLFNKIVNILPVWSVTNLSAGSHFPLSDNSFDLLVIDEASQSDIASALPLLYRAKNVVVIGDTMQLQHISKIGDDQNNRLMSKYNLIENDMLGFSYTTQSLYKCARGLVIEDEIILLNEHYRSHFSIIEFSNSQWYSGNLDIRTNYDNLYMPPVEEENIEWIDIQGNTVRPNNRSARNTKEAEKVLDIMKEIIQLYSGERPSFGIVTPFSAQANHIEDKITDKYDEEFISEHFLIVDTAHKFQGDERDIVIFSPVISRGVSNRSSTVRFLQRTKNLFNVAITRARSLLWVVGDKRKCVNSGVGFLKNFVEYIEHKKYNDLDLPYDGFQSPWEKNLYESLVSLGHEPEIQKSAGPYFLDLALTMNGKKLAIEVDGEYWHTDISGQRLERDIVRDNNLEKMGWEVIRFWVHDLKYDLDNCIKRIEKRLA